MGVAGWPGPGDYPKLYHTESDERRIRRHARRKRVLEALSEAQGTPDTIPEPAGPSGPTPTGTPED
jgi:hypothetical protein